jgi:rubrerythrin
VLESAIGEEVETYRMLTELAARNVDPQGTAVFEQLASEELEACDRLQRLSESEAIRLLVSLPDPGRAAGR